MIWNTLGIEPTKDKKAIVAAYRAKLVEVNPEDKPEEFKALRAAYEEALAQISTPEKQEDDSPLGRWAAKLRKLYDHFPSRIDTECWRELLRDEICVALDQRPLVEETLLKFLLQDYYIPRSVWQLLDEAFDFTGRQQELYEHYPRDFIDYAVISGITMNPSLPYELFTPGENGRDCDEYRRLYHKVNNCPPEEREAVLEQMAALSEHHPYGDAVYFLHLLSQGRTEEGKAGLKQLAEQYPDDERLVMLWANQCGSWEITEPLVRHVLELNPNHAQAKRALAECLAARGDYDAGKELIFELIHAAGGDQVAVQQLQDILKNWNQTLIQKGEERLAADPGDSHAAKELAWCYMQCEDTENAWRAAQYVRQEVTDPFEYHNLMGKLHYARQEGEEALAHFEALEAILQDPDHPKAHRYPEFLQISGSTLMNLGRSEEAIAKYQKALELAPEDPTILDHMGRLLYYREDHEAAADIYQRLTRVQPHSYHGYLMLSLNLFELRRDRDAFDAINRALDIEGRDLTVYVHKMRILLRNGAFDEVRQILEFLNNSGVGQEISVKWCEAQLTEFADKDADRARQLYREIEERLDQGENLPWAQELYYRLTVLTAPKLDMNTPGDRELLIGILDKGLACKPDDEDCLDYKAWLLKRGGSTEAALELYRKMEAKPGHSLNAEQGIAECCYEDLAHNAGQALEYYQILLRHRESPDLHFYVATCLRYMGDFEGAEAHYLKEQELDPTDLDGYNGLARVYKALGRNADALEQVNKAISHIPEDDRDYSWLYNHKSNILRRMGLHQEAVKTQEEAIARFRHPGGYQNRFEILCQFGQWEQAKKALDAWTKAQGGNSANAKATVMLQLYQGKMMKATLAFAGSSRLLDAYETDEIKMQVAELEGNSERSLRVWQKRAKTDGDRSRTLNLLAQSQLHTGDVEGARITAQKSLELIDETLTQNLTDEALYRTQRSKILAILGRIDEAKEELERARKLPLCDFCTYGTCKDADVFEAEIEEIAGNRDRAMELFQAGAVKWPDELDFAAGIARLKKRK